MGDVFKRTCGCGQVIGLREGCQRCADAARARLHAEGKGSCERGGLICLTQTAYDNGTYVPETSNRVYYSKPLDGSEWPEEQSVPWEDWSNLKLPSGRAVSVTPAPGLRVVERTREELAELYKPRGLVCDEVTTYDPMLYEHIKAHAELLNDAVRDGRLVISGTGKDLAERMQNTPGKIERFVAVDPGFDDSESVAITYQRRADGTLMVEDVQRLKPPAQCEHPQLRKDYTSGTCPDCEGTVSWMYGSAFTIAKKARKDKPELPPVGAEVSWSEAERDMQRRQEARYKCARYPHNSYCCTEDGLRVDWKSGQEFIEPYHLNIEGDRWTRLPDATAVPELVWPKIGDECSWEVAECHMRRDSEARYSHAAANGCCVYRVEAGQLMSVRPDKDDCSASFKGGYERTGAWRRHA
jgi:hypothetical protein